MKIPWMGYRAHWWLAFRHRLPEVHGSGLDRNQREKESMTLRYVNKYSWIFYCMPIEKVPEGWPASLSSYDLILSRRCCTWLGDDQHRSLFRKIEPTLQRIFFDLYAQMYNSSHVSNTLGMVARRSISPFFDGMPRIWTEVSAHSSLRATHNTRQE